MSARTGQAAAGRGAARWARRWAGANSPVKSNLVARVLALAALTVASLLIARTAGAEGVAALSLLRLLPWLVGVVLGGGLYGAAPYFLSGTARAEPSYRATFPAIAITAGVVGAGAWVGLAPVLHHAFFQQLAIGVVVAAAVTVPTQLLETTAKACSQGVGDMTGSNRIIVLEELLFIPLYWTLTAAGVGHYMAMVTALALGDLLDAGQGWVRLVRRGFLTGGRPSLAAARAIVCYGTRAELSSIALLLNARLDFAIVATIAGPAPLGIYAVASRYAELLRLPGLAMNYVLYPAYAAQERIGARADAREALRRMAWLPAAIAVPMAVAAPAVLPALFGAEFRPGVVPSCLLLVGLAGGGVTGIISAYLYAVGRPGVVSAAQGLGVVLTVGLDLTLIPRYGITGAAIASSIAYLSAAAMLLATFHPLQRAPADGGNPSVADHSTRPAEEALT
jgi:O-antigen/teichoic acid export membrane protein